MIADNKTSQATRQSVYYRQECDVECVNDGTNHGQVFVRELATTADAPQRQQGTHDLYQLLADHVGSMCAEHVVLGTGPLKDMHIQLLLLLTKVHCRTTPGVSWAALKGIVWIINCFDIPGTMP